MKKTLIHSTVTLLAIGILIAGYAQLSAPVAAGPFVPAYAGASQPGYDKKIYVNNIAGPSITVLDQKRLSVIDILGRNFFRDVVVETTGEPDTTLGAVYKSSGHFISTDGDYVFVCMNVASPYKAFVMAVSTADASVRTFPETGCGVGNWITNDGKYLFTTDGKTKINVFDVKNQVYLGGIPSDGGTHQYWTNDDDTLLWQADRTNKDVVVWDISGLPNVASVTRVTTIDMSSYGPDQHGMILHPNGRYAFAVSFYPGGKTSIIDTATYQVVKTFDTTAYGIHVPDISGDGKLLAGGSLVYGNEEIFDVSTLNDDNPDFDAIVKIADIDLTPQAPSGVSHTMFTQDGKSILVTGNSFSGPAGVIGVISIIDRSTFEVVRVLPVGKSPHGMACSEGDHSR